MIWGLNRWQGKIHKGERVVVGRTQELDVVKSRHRLVAALQTEVCSQWSAGGTK